MNVYVEKEKNDVLRLLNNSGVTIAQDEFVILGGFCAVAENQVLNGAIGEFQVEEGLQVQASDLTTGEDTFATPGQKVYHDPVSDTFSDTISSAYLEVGVLTQVKDANGVIVFDKYRYPLVVQSDET